MRKNYFLKSAMLLGASLFMQQVIAQNPILSAWEYNTTGQKASYQYYPNFPSTSTTSTVNMTDSTGIIKVCYNSNYVWVRTESLPDFQMGPWTNPNVPAAHSKIYKIPLNPTQQTGTLLAVPTGGAIGLAIDGTPLYGNRSADSYNNSTNTNGGTGNNVWHCDAWVNEGSTMDAGGNGHNDANSNYHYHANPATLYSTSGSAHSGILGYALDGYPVYGPFGYTNATNASSGISRMSSSYQLRNITTRTTLPDGSTASSPGPNVSTTFPLGTYVEDYEYINGLGTLDEYNGRYCVTPEYPSGTYAYFITTDNSGLPAYPYILAINYYGTANSSDLLNAGNATVPTGSGVTCITSSSVGVKSIQKSSQEMHVYPNPFTGVFRLDVEGQGDYIVMNALGKVIKKGAAVSGTNLIDLGNVDEGLYFLQFKSEDTTKSIKLIKE